MTQETLIRVLKGVALWLPTVLLSALFAMQGVMKLAGLEAWIERFREFGYPDGFYLVVGAAELGGSLLLLVPRVARFGALSLATVMLGAAVTHLVRGETAGMVFTSILMVAFAIITYFRTPEEGFMRIVKPA